MAVGKQRNKNVMDKRYIGAEDNRGTLAASWGVRPSS
jgi:hypothetical protein